MTLKVLVTCPPMLRQIDEFSPIFSDLNIEITTPNVIQTLSEKELKKIVPLHHGWIIGDDPATEAVFKAGKNGSLVAAIKWGIGTDNVDFDACEKLDIPITNTPGMFGSEVADLAMCYILGLARDAFFIDREIRSGGWPKPSGSSLNGKVLGIVGLGDIGQNIAKRANAHDLDIIGWDPFSKDLPKYINLQKKWPDSISICDFLVFACALNKNNQYMFNEKIINMTKQGIRVVNVSRGPLINEEDLLNGLRSGQIKSVALDVFEREPLQSDHEIFNHPKCILGSHNASNTIDAVRRASIEAIKLLNNMLNDKLRHG